MLQHLSSSRPAQWPRLVAVRRIWFTALAVEALRPISADWCLCDAQTARCPVRIARRSLSGGIEFQTVLDLCAAPVMARSHVTRISLTANPWSVPVSSAKLVD